MKSLRRLLVPSLAVLGSVMAIAAAAVPTAVGESLPAAFAIGDTNAVVGEEVTLWGAQWWKDNELSAGQTRASFKGYALDVVVDRTTCTFTSRTGNSPPPPEGALPSPLTVLVTDSVRQDGSTISGTITGFAQIDTTVGYADTPGHYGTGTVVGVTPCIAGGSGGGGEL